MPEKDLQRLEQSRPPPEPVWEHEEDNQGEDLPLIYSTDLPGALVNEVLKMNIGQSQEEALRTELCSKVKHIPKGLTVTDIIEIWSLNHWFKHYKKGNQFWVPLDGKKQRVTCLEINAVDRCMVVIDQENRRRELYLDTKEVIEQIQDDESRRIQRLSEAQERLDGHGAALDARLDSLQKALEVTRFKIQKFKKARTRLREGVDELKGLFDERRHKFSKVLGTDIPTKEEMLDSHQ